MNILIALDGSINSYECINELIYFALDDKTNIHLVVVCDESLLAPHRMDTAAGSRILERAKEKFLKLYPNLVPQCDLRAGHAAEQLLLAQAEMQADVMLAGAHSPRPFPLVLLGSVAAHLAKDADCSIRLLRKHSSENRVIVCLENSPIDRAVVDEVKKLHFPPGSVMAFLHALNIVSTELSENAHVDALLFNEKRNHTQNQIKNIMDRYASEIKQLYPELSVETIISPEIDAQAAIIETAASWRATTIVVGSHRREGLEKFWLGNVSEPVSAAAPCSVHIARHTQILHTDSAK